MIRRPGAAVLIEQQSRGKNAKRHPIAAAPKREQVARIPAVRANIGQTIRRRGK